MISCIKIQKLFITFTVTFRDVCLLMYKIFVSLPAIQFFKWMKTVLKHCNFQKVSKEMHKIYAQNKSQQ